MIDYRYLNSQTTDDSFPLPVIEDLITSQALNNIWSFLTYKMVSIKCIYTQIAILTLPS